jgi:ribonuclease HI
MKLDTKNKTIVFTDGASKGNPGAGGWGAIILTSDHKVKELGKAYSQVTNNQMEMLAAISALKHLSSHAEPVHIYTDSSYLIHGITQWIWGWLKRGWKTSQGDDVSNKEYWQQLLSLVELRKKNGHAAAEWHHVRGHAGVEGNERADQIASDLAAGLTVQLYEGSISAYNHDVLVMPEDFGQSTAKQGKKSSSSKKAYSYLSYVNGVLRIHKSWSECEAHVKGRSGAKFKKATSAEDERNIARSWGAEIS